MLAIPFQLRYKSPGSGCLAVRFGEGTRRSKMVAVFAMVPLAGALFLLSKSIRMCLRDKASASWPTVAGEILHSAKGSEATEHGSHACPELRYEYTVKGKQ